METFGEMKWKRYINLLLWEGHDKAPEGPSSETPGADSQNRTNISWAKSVGVKVYKMNKTAPGLLLLSEQLQNGWLFFPLIGQKNIFVANQCRASPASLSCLFT